MKTRRSSQFTLAVVAAALIGIVAVAPASAGRPDHFSIDYDGVPDSLCGMSLVLDGFEHGTFQLKPRRDGSDLAAFNVHFRLRITNTATGRWLLAEFNGSSGKELRVTNEGNGIIAIVGQVAGIDRYRASDGSRVFQAAGNSRTAIRIDLKDLNNPDDDVVLNEQQVKNSGLRFGTGDCGTIRSLIG